MNTLEKETRDPPPSLINKDSSHHLIERLKAPLQFASKNNFAALERVKNLSHTLITIAASDPQLASFAIQARQLDELSVEDKKKCIHALLEQLSNLQTTAAESPPINRITERLVAPKSVLPDPTHIPVTAIKGISEKTATLLAGKNIFTVRDLLYFLPFRYEDRRLRTSIREAPVGQRVTLTGTIIALGPIHLRGGRKLFEMAVSDDTGVIHLKWFQFRLALFQSRFRIGMSITICGIVDVYGRQKQMVHPDIDVIADDANHDEMASIVPIYSEITGIYPKRLRAMMAHALSYAEALVDVLPRHLFLHSQKTQAKTRQLPTLSEALQRLHQPPSNTDFSQLADRSPAHERLILEELLILQLGLIRRRLRHQLAQGIQIITSADEIDRAAKQLFSFNLTAAQNRVCNEIMANLQSGRPMHRLVQGDVGSGKTAVAFLAGYRLIRAGYQAALMAPTEILAEQHFKNAVHTLHPQGIRLGFLTANIPSAEAKETLRKIKHREIDFIIGTHALIQSRVEFAALGLAIVDEQHRFGVVQRAELRQKRQQRKSSPPFGDDCNTYPSYIGFDLVRRSRCVNH